MKKVVRHRAYPIQLYASYNSVNPIPTRSVDDDSNCSRDGMGMLIRCHHCRSYINDCMGRIGSSVGPVLGPTVTSWMKGGISRIQIE